MHPFVARASTFLAPERALDADARAALRDEDCAVNAARVRTWALPLVALQTIITLLVHRYAVRSPTEAVWHRNLMAIECACVAACAALAALGRRWRSTPARVSRLHSGVVMLLSLAYAAMGVNAQLVTGNVISYVGVTLALPYYLRAEMPWWLVTTPLSSAVLLAGIAAVQRHPLLRDINLVTVAGFTLLSLAMAREQRRAVVTELGLRRMLERFNGELEARVESQTHALRSFAQRLDEGLEAERRRLARDLHDDLGQELTALRLEVGALRATAADTRAGAALARMAAGVDRAHLGVRAILESLRPRILDEEGLAAALRWLAQRLERRGVCRCVVTVSLEDEPDALVGLVAFRVAQEAMTNILRHADATRVSVSLTQRDGTLTLAIDDDGASTRASPIAPGRGLTGMQERVLGVGGTLVVRSLEPRGLQVRATLPLRRARDASPDDAVVHDEGATSNGATLEKI